MGRYAPSCALLLLVTAVSSAQATVDDGASLERFQADRTTAVQRLTAKGTVDSLAAAATLEQFGEETNGGAYALVARAVELAPGRRDVAWLAVRLCTAAPDCNPEGPEKHLRSVDPENGIGLMGALTRAQARNDLAAIDSTLTAIGHARRFYVYFAPLVAATAPELALARHRGSGQSSPRELARATIEMIAVVAASVLPPSQSLSFSCQGMALQRVPGRLERCQAASRVFERADTFILEGLGLSLHYRLASPQSAEAQALSVRRRTFQYRLEEYNRLSVSSSKIDEVPSDLIEVFRAHDREQDVALVYFGRAGVPADPPPNWTSTQPPRVP